MTDDEKIGVAIRRLNIAYALLHQADETMDELVGSKIVPGKIAEGLDDYVGLLAGIASDLRKIRSRRKFRQTLEEVQ